jgi:hypothetical protein
MYTGRTGVIKERRNETLAGRRVMTREGDVNPMAPPAQESSSAPVMNPMQRGAARVVEDPEQTGIRRRGGSKALNADRAANLLNIQRDVAERQATPANIKPQQSPAQEREGDSGLSLFGGGALGAMGRSASAAIGSLMGSGEAPTSREKRMASEMSVSAANPQVKGANPGRMEKEQKTGGGDVTDLDTDMD